MADEEQIKGTSLIPQVVSHYNPAAWIGFGGTGSRRTWFPKRSETEALCSFLQYHRWSPLADTLSCILMDICKAASCTCPVALGNREGERPCRSAGQGCAVQVPLWTPDRSRQGTAGRTYIFPHADIPGIMNARELLNSPGWKKGQDCLQMAIAPSCHALCSKMFSELSGNPVGFTPQVFIPSSCT